MNLVTMISGKTFYAEKNVSILNAAESQGVTLPYSCRVGRCHSCKCKISGPSTTKFDELGLTDSQKKDGWKLACARTAIGDILIDIEDLTNVNLPTPKIFPAKIDEIDFLTQNILKINLRLPPNLKFKFLEGQHINLIAPNGITRSYSLARYCDGQNLEIHVQRLMNGQMSKYFFEEAKVGDLLRINGPHGTFIFQNTPKTKIIFLATGTGIAPVKAILEYIERMPQELAPDSIKIYWGMRSEKDLYWKPGNRFRNLDFIPVLSQGSNKWEGPRGYVQDIMMQDLKDKTNIKIYSCGSNAMIEEAKSKIKLFGLSEKIFYSDAFVASN